MTEFAILHLMRGSDKLVEAKCRFLRTFPLWCDSGAYVVKGKEAKQMFRLGKVKRSYWLKRMKDDANVILYKSWYKDYTNTWEKITTAMEDFHSGWMACQGK